MKFNYNLKFLFSVRLSQISFPELRSRMSPQSIDVKSVTRKMDYQIWELVLLKFISKVPLMKLMQRKLRIFFRSSTSPTSTHTLASHCQQPQHQGKVDKFVTNAAVSEAEIWWTSKHVIAGYSNNSNADCSCLFLSMFLDSNIAKKYHLVPDKLQYSVNFGLGPYFKSIMMENIRKSAHFVISFDESLNKATQSSELDLLVWYFDVLEMKVSTSMSHLYSWVIPGIQICIAVLLAWWMNKVKINWFNSPWMNQVWTLNFLKLFKMKEKIKVTTFARCKNLLSTHSSWII